MAYKDPHDPRRVERFRRYRERNRDHFRELCRAFNARRSAKRKAYNDDARQRGVLRERDLSRYALAKALRQGIVVKPDTCARCKAVTPGRRLHGHHHDYSDPLSVTWLCTICHGIEHRKAA